MLVSAGEDNDRYFGKDPLNKLLIEAIGLAVADHTGRVRRVVWVEIQNVEATPTPVSSQVAALKNGGVVSNFVSFRRICAQKSTDWQALVPYATKHESMFATIGFDHCRLGG